MKDGLESPDLIVTSTQRQIGALETVQLEQFQTIRTLGGSADATFTFGVRAARPSSGAEGDRYYATDIGAQGGYLYFYTGTAWELLVGVASGTDAERSAYTPDATDDGGVFWTTDTGKLWEVESGAWVDRFVIVDVTTGYQVGGVQVIGAQGAAVADASGGATIDTQARTAINDLLAELRTHGLIAT